MHAMTKHGWIPNAKLVFKRHWFSVMGTFLPFEIITYAI
jgi:hypothetical protein